MENENLNLEEHSKEKHYFPKAYYQLSTESSTKLEFLTKVPGKEDIYVFSPITDAISLLREKNWEGFKRLLQKISKVLFSNVERIGFANIGDKYEEVLAVITALAPLHEQTIKKVKVENLKFISELELDLIRGLMISPWWEKEKTSRVLASHAFLRKFYVTKDPDENFVFQLNEKFTVRIKTEDVLDIIRVVKMTLEYTGKDNTYHRMPFGYILPLKSPKQTVTPQEKKFLPRRIYVNNPIHYEIHEIGDIKILSATDLVNKVFYSYIKFPNKEIFIERSSALLGIERLNEGEWDYELLFHDGHDEIRVSIKEGLMKLLEQIDRTYRIMLALS